VGLDELVAVLGAQLAEGALVELARLGDIRILGIVGAENAAAAVTRTPLDELVLVVDRLERDALVACPDLASDGVDDVPFL